MARIQFTRINWVETVFKLREIDLRIIKGKIIIGRNWIKDDLGLNFKNLILYVEFSLRIKGIILS